MEVECLDAEDVEDDVVRYSCALSRGLPPGQLPAGAFPDGGVILSNSMVSGVTDQ